MVLPSTIQRCVTPSVSPHAIPQLVKLNTTAFTPSARHDERGGVSCHEKNSWSRNGPTPMVFQTPRARSATALKVVRSPSSDVNAAVPRPSVMCIREAGGSSSKRKAPTGDVGRAARKTATTTARTSDPRARRPRPWSVEPRRTNSAPERVGDHPRELVEADRVAGRAAGTHRDPVVDHARHREALPVEHPLDPQLRVRVDQEHALLRAHEREHV